MKKETSRMIKIREKFKIIKKNNVYSESQEHDACGVGLVASTEENQKSS